MILADTNIIIDFWNKPTEKAEQIFRKNEIAICGVVKAELLRGSSSDTEFAQIENALNGFSYLDFLEHDWISLAKQFVLLKESGLSVPFQDAMIACLAIKNRCAIWTNDRHFRLMKTVLSDLELLEV